jgi:hypothetical protein
MNQPAVLFVTWRSPGNRRIYPVGRLLQAPSQPQWEFTYIEGSRDAEPHGFAPFLEFPEIDQVYRSDDLFPFFQLRLMASSRPDFAHYVHRLGLRPEERSPLVILARSAGRSTTDRVELIAPPVFDRAKAGHVSYFFARGIRYLPDAEPVVAALRRDDRLEWSPEPQNEHDPHAIALFGPAHTLVGRVPFYLVDDLQQLIVKAAELDVFVEQVNLPPSPADQRLLCRLETRWKNGFVPFATERFEPRAKMATRLAGKASVRT